MSNTILNSGAFFVKAPIDAASAPNSVKLISNPEFGRWQENQSDVSASGKGITNESGEFVLENVFETIYCTGKPIPADSPYFTNHPVYLVGPTSSLRSKPGTIFNYSKITLVPLKKTTGSFWEVESIYRGFIFEEMLKANLRKIKNYPVIDDFRNGVATSIKTLVLSAEGYTINPQRIYSKLKKYIDDLSNFNGTDAYDVDTFGKITSKKLELGIPPNATSEQVQKLERAVKYAEGKNILLNIRVVK